MLKKSIGSNRYCVDCGLGAPAEYYCYIVTAIKILENVTIFIAFKNEKDAVHSISAEQPYHIVWDPRTNVTIETYVHNKISIVCSIIIIQ